MTGNVPTQLERLAKPFPPKMVANKQGASYVNHGIVQQRLIGTIGPPDQRVVEFIRGDYDEVVTNPGDQKKERTWPGRTNAVVGVVLAVDYHIDGRTVHIEDVGVPEGYYMAAHDGERAKKAVSDAVKRCAKQVGVALNLWSKGAYFLPKMLEKYARVVDPENPDGPQRVVDTETGEILEEQAAEQHDPDAPDPDDTPVDDAEPQPQQRQRSNGSTPPAAAPPPETDDPGSDAYPGDDMDRPGADRDHARMVDEVKKLAERLLPADKQATAVAYASAKMANAQQSLDDLRKRDAANGQDDTSAVDGDGDSTDGSAADGDGDESIGFTPAEFGKLARWGIDKKARHDLAHIVSDGRTSSSKACDGRERARILELGRCISEGDCAIAYDGHTGTPRLVSNDGELLDPWTLQPAAEAKD